MKSSHFQIQLNDREFYLKAFVEYFSISHICIYCSLSIPKKLSGVTIGSLGTNSYAYCRNKGGPRSADQGGFDLVPIPVFQRHGGYVIMFNVLWNRYRKINTTM